MFEHMLIGLDLQWIKSAMLSFDEENTWLWLPGEDTPGPIGLIEAARSPAAQYLNSLLPTFDNRMERRT